MLPKLEELGITYERFEIEWISPKCVRLVGWVDGERMLTLFANPQDQHDLAELLQVVEVFYTSQAGLDRKQVWRNINRREHGHETHRGKVVSDRRRDSE